MKISRKGIELIKRFEGLRLKAYKCPAGVLTIGFGHTRGVLENKTITEKEAVKLLKEDLEIFEKAVKNFTKIPINQNEYDALVSFVYNIGQTAFKNSTLLKKLNNGDKIGAANQFLRWNKAGGKVLNGLVKRREAEKKLFEEK